MRHPWKESEEGTVHLQEETPAAFRIYLQWLYRGPTIPTVAWSNTKPTRFQLLSDAYVMGDMLQDNSFKNSVLDSIHAQTEVVDENGVKYLPRNSINTIYNNTTESCPLRKYLVDAYLIYGHHEDFEKRSKSECLPEEFLMNLVAECMKTRKTGVPESITDLSPYYSNSPNKHSTSAQPSRRG